jgi:hypothetical protein
MFKGILFNVVLYLVPVVAFAQAEFPTADQTQQHCPTDTVVWLNTNSGVYHFQGERWYGRTKDGAYVCLHEADHAGDRATENGQ